MGKKIKYIASVYSSRLIEWMAKRAGKQNQNFVDKGVTSLLKKMVKTEHLEVDYMADEWLNRDLPLKN